MKINILESIKVTGKLKSTLFVIVNVIFLSWLYVKSDLSFENEHVEYLGNLQSLKALNTQINAETFASYMNYVRNYDLLANDIQKASTLSKLILRPPNYLHKADQKEINSQTRLLAQAFTEKTHQIDLFKRNNAIIKNSLNYFQKIIEEYLAQQVGSELQAMVSDYARYLMYFVKDPQADKLVNIKIIQNNLKLAMTKQEDITDIEYILMHGRILYSYRQKIDDQIQLFLHVPSKQQHEKLILYYIESYSRVLAIAHQYKQVLYVYSMLLSLYLAYVFLRLNRANRSISSAHEELKERYRLQQIIEEKLMLHATAFSNASEAITLTDNKGVMIDMNPAFSRITGYTREEAIGSNPSILKSGKHDAAFYKNMWDNINSKNHWRGEIWNRKKSGEIYPEILSITAIRDDQDKISNFVSVFSDISYLKEHEKKLEQMAFYDELTKLPNRALLTERINQGISQIKRSNEFMAVCFMDLDGFKPINDTYGHEAGNQCLIEMSSRLKGMLRDGDTVARIGGDEFVLLLVGLKEAQEYNIALNRLIKVISQPVKIVDDFVKVTASVGVTLYPEDNHDADTLLRHADQAMYKAKQKGKNCFVVFDYKNNIAEQQFSKKIKAITTALEQKQFVLYYQPKIQFSNGDIVGYEALIRWQHPEQGLLGPNEFLPFIENSPLITEIGNWVLSEALSQLKAWNEQGIHTNVSVNVAGRQLQNSFFASNLKLLLAQYPTVESSQLELEILETTALEDVFNVSKIIEKCHELGVNLAIDDFGTGYSSLTYLKQLPAKTLKIDIVFIKDMLEDPGSLAIVHGILGLTTAFQKNSVAEGVETLEHGLILMKLGCQVAQGYGISKPMPAEDVCQWQKDWQFPMLWREHADLYWDDVDYPMLAAEVEHRRWVKLVMESVKKGALAKLRKIKDYHYCQFGRWYYNEGKKRYQHLSEFQQLEQPHKELHKVANEINLMIQEGNIEQANEQAQLLLTLKDEIIVKLRKLSLAVASKKQAVFS